LIPQRTVLIDTGPIVALFDRSESFHQKTRDYIKEYDGRLLTTLSAFTESFWLLKNIPDAGPNLLEWVHRGGLQFSSLERTHFRRLRTLTVQYDDVPMDFADATLVALAEQKQISEILSFDSDFDVYQINGEKPFQRLPESN